MRRWVMAAIVAGLAQGAQAADLPDLSDLPVLRGGFTDGLSQSSVNWQGAYVGGQFGYSNAGMDFSKALSSLTSTMLQNNIVQSTVSGWSVLGKSNPGSTSFGGFVGWNSQWDDVILGIEGNYNHFANLKGSSTGTVGPLSINPAGASPPPNHTYVYNVGVTGAASAQVTDALTLRGRAGWAIDNFMPYMFGGLALGRVNISRSVTMTETIDDYLTTTVVNNGVTTTNTTKVGTSTQPTLSQSDVANGSFAYGYTAGLGLEAMLFGNVFGRAEYEYIKFSSVKNIDVHINTVRAAVGYKF